MVGILTLLLNLSSTFKIDAIAVLMTAKSYEILSLTFDLPLSNCLALMCLPHKLKMRLNLSIFFY